MRSLPLKEPEKESYGDVVIKYSDISSGRKVWGEGGYTSLPFCYLISLLIGAVLTINVPVVYMVRYKVSSIWAPKSRDF